jgi:hypothetical protein
MLSTWFATFATFTILANTLSIFVRAFDAVLELCYPVALNQETPFAKWATSTFWRYVLTGMVSCALAGGALSLVSWVILAYAGRPARRAYQRTANRLLETRAAIYRQFEWILYFCFGVRFIPDTTAYEDSVRDLDEPIHDRAIIERPLPEQNYFRNDRNDDGEELAPITEAPESFHARNTNVHFGPYVSGVATRLKAEGLGSSGVDTPDTRRQTLERAQRMMRDWGVRPTTIANQAPVAVVLAFTPNRGEIIARQLAASTEVHRRHQDHSSKWVDARSWWCLPAPPALP